MGDNATPIELLFEKAEDYSKTTIELFKLNAIDKSADVLSSIVARIVVAVVVALFIVIIRIGIALWIGELLGKSYYGFFVIARCYLLFALLLYSFRHQWIKTLVSNSIINQMLKKKKI